MDHYGYPEETDPSAHYIVRQPGMDRRFVGLGGALRFARSIARLHGEEVYVYDAGTGETHEVLP